MEMKKLLKKQMKKDKSLGSAIETQGKVGTKIDFASSEAYKLLRTNLSFSLTSEEDMGRVFGMTSSISGEGKSLTSINLAISFAETEKRVLLIECDMRKPVFEKYFQVRTPKGLSHVLAGHCKLAETVFKQVEYPNLHCISAGTIPPNPSELLSSANMKLLVECMKKQFDIIILDLPPLTAVADATIVSQYTDGMILVVRDNYVEKSDLQESIRLLTLSETKILGMVYNVHDLNKGHYYKKGYKYYKKYEAYQS